MDLSIAQIRHFLQLPAQSGSGSRRVHQLLTDSRNLTDPAQTLFVALESARQDGHQFICELYEKGVRAFLVSHLSKGDLDRYDEADFVQVPDTLTALQQLAATWRRQFTLPVIGITGSNGKTMVKEWLFQLLAADFHIVRNPKSYNSQTGVPLSIAAIDGAQNLGIFEAGISLPGEMARLEKIIQPTIGLFTNIGEAHAEGFKDLRHKVREKLQLFEQVTVLIYRSEQAVVNEEVERLRRSRSAHQPLSCFSWTVQQADQPASSARLVVTDIQTVCGDDGTKGTRIEARYQQRLCAITIPFSDAGAIENAVHCWCMLLYLQIPQDRIANRMRQLQPVAMRLQMQPGMQDCTLINDSYNSDFASIRVALDFLTHQGQHPRRALILSDVVQSGEDERILYTKIAALVAERKIDRFIGIGPALMRQKDLFQQPVTAFFPTTDAFMQAVQQKNPGPALDFHQETILLKGARQFGFERISKLLELKKHQAVLQVNLNAIVHNLKTYQALLRPEVRTMVMVKAFSYGSGSAEVANLLQYYRVDYLAVATIDEGIDLRKKGIVIPILVLNPDPFYLDALLDWRLEPELYSFPLLKAFYKKVQTGGLTKYAIHLKLDTGMHRLGFMPSELPELVAFLQQQSLLKVASVFSHLAAAETPSMDAFTRRQGRLFDQMSRAITEVLPYPVLRHLANTSGISRHPDLQFDMVRLGIGLYGIDPVMESKLQVVHRLQAVISQVKTIPAGETIGYGRRGKSGHGKRIGVVALGYADGYLRTLGGGKGQVYLHGRFAPTIGNICMDMLMIDLTEIAEAREGDMVVIFGEQPPIATVAGWGGTIPYEILAGLSQRIVRVYVHE